MHAYTWYQWLLMFYLFSFFGWIFESTYVSILKKQFVNRGFLRLPLLPLYGTGAVMLLWLTLPFQDHLALVYLTGVVAATILEYITGWAMEQLFKVKYWDYSNQRFQLNGYICLSSSIAWGFLTLLLTEVIDRPVSRLLLSASPLVEIVCCLAVSAFFAADTIASVRAALDLAKVLEAMTRMQGELDELQVQMALLRSETSQRMEKVKDTASMKLALLKAQASAKTDQLRLSPELLPSELVENTAERLEAIMAQKREQISSMVGEHTAHLNGILEDRTKLLSEKLSMLLQKRKAFLSNMDFYRKGLLRGNPSISSTRFGAALKELREAAWGRRTEDR